MHLATNPVARPRTVYVALLFVVGNVFLAGCSAQNSPPKFDSARAFAILQKQCEFGPRPVGSAAHDKTRDYLVGELRPYAESVELQNFEHVLAGKTYKLSNIVARFGSKTDTRGILLCAHWDTRPTADEELEAADRKRPILGANDGASGVAVLLELARMFHERPTAVPVTIVLFDGEDFGPTGKDMFLGSRYFASKLGNKTLFRYGILLDMVGDKELKIYREGNSQTAARFVLDKIWSAALKLGYQGTFKDEVRYTIGDDHVPLIEAGLPCADVIDFDYAYWHTLDDTVDKCSAESLKVVGEIIAEVVYSERPGS
ncbi:MAG TPA: M28 family peptidase [Armatimonadota bacterium]|nr:M28 family peptidase [Armatimonadota bacterium]